MFYWCVLITNIWWPMQKVVFHKVWLTQNHIYPVYKLQKWYEEMTKMDTLIRSFNHEWFQSFVGGDKICPELNSTASWRISSPSQVHHCWAGLQFGCRSPTKWYSFKLQAHIFELPSGLQETTKVKTSGGWPLRIVWMGVKENVLSYFVARFIHRSTSLVCFEDVLLYPPLTQQGLVISLFPAWYNILTHHHHLNFELVAFHSLMQKYHTKKTGTCQNYLTGSYSVLKVCNHFMPYSLSYLYKCLQQVD